MRGKLSMIVALAFAPLAAVAADKPECRVITVQPGQGSAIAVQIPVRNETSAPYALTGRTDQGRAVREVPMQFGQGGFMLVPMPD